MLKLHILLFAEWVRNEDTYFIVSPYDVLVAKPRTEDDHVAWLIKHKMFEVSYELNSDCSRDLKNTCLLNAVYVATHRKL